MSNTKPHWGLMAEFATPHELVAAAREATEHGYRQVDCHTPFPLHELDEAMGVRPTILPWIVFGGGATGFVTAMALQAWTNGINYAFVISNKPLMSWPADIPVAFELTILFAALSAVAGMFILNLLPSYYHPAFKVPHFDRATTDRFFLIIKASDKMFSPDSTREFLSGLRPIRIDSLED